VAVRYSFTPLDRDTAAQIAAWRYDGPYALYDGDPAGAESLLRPDYRYQAVRDGDGELIGFCTFGEDARVAGYTYTDDALDVGVGMRPDLVGHGLGLAFTRVVLDFARREYAPAAMRVTIAGFNRRAQRMCLALGFVEEGRFARPGSEDEFVVLVRRDAPRTPGRRLPP
jgi:[ribosomal protein S18]-alanine N-acetyltransferase